MSTQSAAAETAYIRKVLITLGLVVLTLFLWKIAPVLLLAFAGIVIAAVIRAGAVPLARRTGMPEAVAVGLVAFAATALILIGSYLFGQRIASQAQELWSALTHAWGQFQAFVARIPVGEAAMESMKAGTDANALAKVAKGTVSVFGAVADVALVLFLAVYFAADPRSYRRGLLRLFPKGARERVDDALEASGIALQKWLTGQLLAMVSVGVLTGLGLWAIGVPLAVPLAILTLLLDFVPVIGPLMAAIPGILIAFAQSPQLALYAALVYFAMQFVEGHLIMPLAQRWAVAVPPALSMLGIVAFAIAFGLIGLLFAMPLLVVAMVLVQKLYVERLER
jgi:predicted PurR-regulated permease PerM